MTTNLRDKQGWTLKADNKQTINQKLMDNSQGGILPEER